MKNIKAIKITKITANLSNQHNNNIITPPPPHQHNRHLGKNLVLLIGLLALPLFSQAQTIISSADTGFYVGLQIAKGGAFASSESVTGGQGLVIYAGQNFTTLDSTHSFPAINGDPVWLLRGGYAFNDLLAVEARYANTKNTQVHSHKVSIGIDVNRTTTAIRTNQQDDLYGAYLRLSFPGAGRFRPYLLGGWAKLENRNSYTATRVVTVVSSTNVGTGSFIPAPATMTDDGFSGGLGLNVNINKQLDLNIEWMEYTEDFNGVNAGVVFKF